MPNLCQQTLPGDIKKINVHSGQERLYWAQQLNVSELALKIAVAVVGCSVNDVENFLENTL